MYKFVNYKIKSVCELNGTTLGDSAIRYRILQKFLIDLNLNLV